MTHDKNALRGTLTHYAKIFVQAHQTNGRVKGFLLLGEALGARKTSDRSVSLPYDRDPNVVLTFVLRADAVEGTALRLVRPGEGDSALIAPDGKLCNAEEITSMSWPFRL